MILFCPSKDANDEVWNGPRNGKEGALTFFGADESFDIKSLPSTLKALLLKPSTSAASEAAIYVDVPGVSPSTRFRLARQKLQSKSLYDYLLPSATSSDSEDVCSVLNGEKGRVIKSASKEIEKMRVIKSDAEVKVMRRAADISSKAHLEVSYIIISLEKQRLTIFDRR